MKISLTKPALHFPAAIYWHFSHRAEIQFSISWNSARFLYFCIHSFVFLYFPYIDISLADPKFNFRSPEIVKVLWYDRLRQLNMNGQENMFCLLQDIDFFKLYTQGLCVLVFFFFQEGIKVLWWSKASFVFSICICICTCLFSVYILYQCFFLYLVQREDVSWYTKVQQRSAASFAFCICDCTCISICSCICMCKYICIS